MVARARGTVATVQPQISSQYAQSRAGDGPLGLAAEEVEIDAAPLAPAPYRAATAAAVPLPAPEPVSTASPNAPIAGLPPAPTMMPLALPRPPTPAPPPQGALSPSSPSLTPLASIEHRAQPIPVDAAPQRLAAAPAPLPLPPSPRAPTRPAPSTRSAPPRATEPMPVRSGAHAVAPAEPVVRVHIGRIDVRASAPPPQVRVIAPPERPDRALAHYLEERNRGRR
jgi:hypothetical protein